MDPISHPIVRRGRVWLAGARGDGILYTSCAVLAAGLGLTTVYHGHRVWGWLAAAGYALGAVTTVAFVQRRRLGTGGHGGATRARVLIAAGVFVLTALVPLVVLVAQRAAGVPWSGQPEVDVVERAARLLLTAGTPYADLTLLGRPPVFQDYTPYLPVMALFGMPRVLHPAAVTDARVVLAASAALLAGIAVAVLRRAPARRRRWWPPVRAAQLIAVAPTTTLTLAVGGDDLPILGLLLVALVAVQLRRPGAAGLAGGLALAAKLTAAPVLLIVALVAHRQHGRWGAGRTVLGALAIGVVAVLPVVLVAPAPFVEHVLRFPAGLAAVRSPAASPLPGYLLARLGTLGRVVDLVALAALALAVLVWLVRRPPATAAQGAGRAAVALTGAMLLMPATRFGYLVYPVVLAGAALALRSWERQHTAPEADPRAAEGELATARQ